MEKERKKGRKEERKKGRKEERKKGRKKERVPAQLDALEFLSLVVKAAGYTVHAEFVPSYGRHRWLVCVSHSQLRVDAVCAMRT